MNVKASLLHFVRRALTKIYKPFAVLSLHANHTKFQIKIKDLGVERGGFVLGLLVLIPPLIKKKKKRTKRDLSAVL